MASPARVGAGVGLAAVLALAAPVVMKWEGLRLDPYNDVTGLRTVCYGETRNVEEREYSPAECRALLAASLHRHASPIVKCLPVSTPVEVQAAFVSFGYNVGTQAACSSTAAKRARAGDLRGACDALTWWTKVRNPVTGQLQFSRGLANRRMEERALCLEGVS